MRKHIMLVCKGLGICCARLPRQAPGTAGRRAEEGGAVRGSRGRGARGGEERGVPETRQCGYRATPGYHAKTRPVPCCIPKPLSNHDEELASGATAAKPS